MPRNSVDLPAPLGPTTASSAPGRDLAVEVMHRRMPVVAQRDVAELQLRGHAHLIASQTTAHSPALTASAAPSAGNHGHAQDRPGRGLRRMRRRRPVAMRMGVARTVVVAVGVGMIHRECYIIT